MAFGSALLAISATCMCNKPSDSVTVRDLDASAVLPDEHATYWIDCVETLHVVQTRGMSAANARRLGAPGDPRRLNQRISDLAEADLRELCDWETCLRSNGYGHVCAVDDAGIETCRVCAAGDCGDAPSTPDDCVAHAKDPGRADCHVGLLEECLLQTSIRGPADPRVTTTCDESARACAGELPGDLSDLAKQAQTETDQVTMQVASEELELAETLEPDASLITYWQEKIAAWDGGLPEDVDGGGS